MSLMRTFRDFDWLLWGATSLICALGVLQIYSATRDSIWRNLWTKQILCIAAGAVLAWVLSRLDYHTLLGQVPVLYVGMVALLVATFVFGAAFFGSRRWIPLFGGFHLQISEFAKLVLVLLMARYLSSIRNDRLEARDLLRLTVLFAIPMGLVMKQPDLTTSLTYLPILGIGIYLVGLRWQYWAAIVALCAVLLPLGWFLYLKDYQKARLTSFMDPERDPRGSGYQVIQSKIAVGSGGLWGKGVTKGEQTKLRFLPVPHTDFILAAFAEEHGFVGVLLILGLYLLLLLGIVQNAQGAADKAGMYICMGISMTLLFQILVNVGMVIGRMPVGGIPLPLMSYGGSSILSTFLMLGVVNNVRLRRV
ncbi:MAG: rod shape-determining protein RodA [Bryobacteraceae bacterium]|nr:rod shape-determining protein RodA [Bryobacteraceae bacterium]MDW8376646.1 rod shape-determining protein RodA [Bryobacterales bacterium]